MTEIFFYAILPGLIGGTVRGLVGITKNIVGKKQKFYPTRLILSLFVSALSGVVASLFVSGDWRLALLAGYAGVDFIEGMYKTRLLTSFKKF